MSNPIDKYLEKKAGFGDAMNGMKPHAMNALAGAGAMGALSVGTAAVSFGAEKLYDAITKRQDFRTMMEQNPDLHELQAENPKFFNNAYSGLRSVNRQFSAEPLIAGNYMRNMMQSQATAGGALENAFSASKGSPVLEGMSKALQEGGKVGLTRPRSPNHDLANEVQGLQLQKQKGDLLHPPEDPMGADKAWLEERQLKSKMQRHMQPAPFETGGGNQQSLPFQRNAKRGR